MLLDLLLLLLVFFLVSSLFRAFTVIRKPVDTGRDSLKMTQEMSRRTAMFQGMSPKEEEEYADSLSIGVCFSRFALQVAAADGQLTQAEILSILSFFRGAQPAYVQHIQAVLEKDLMNPSSIDWDYNLAEAKRILAKPAWAHFTAILFEGLMRISLSNGYLGERESAVIFRIMEGLGWTRSQTESWFKHGGRGQQGAGSRGSGGTRVPRADAIKEAADILGVKPDDDLETIKKRYRSLVREHHPDRYAQMGEEMQKSATARFQAIQSAWETLSSRN